MLEFVHLSGSEAGKDLQTRRKVRSQAMRDFRRRQRAERDAATNPSSTQTLPSKRGVRKPPPPERPVSKILDFRKKDCAETAPAHDLKALPDRSRGVEETSTVSSSRKLPRIVVPSHKSVVPASALGQRQSQAHQTPLWSPTSFESESTSSTSTTRWCAEMDDPFQSPAQLNEMSDFCKSYIRWLNPGVDSDKAEGVLSNAWEVSQCPMLLASCCLASVGHLDAVHPSRPNGNYALYKARILQEVSERMQSPDAATSDEVIGTLACLLSFELSQGSSEALTHLRGLRSIIKMRGGMETLASTNLQSMLEMLDLLHATIFNAEPVLASPTFDDHSSLSDADALSRCVPLLIAEQEAFPHLDSSLKADMQILSDFLQSATTFLDRAAGLSTHINDAQSADRLHELAARLKPTAGSDRLEGGNPNPVVRASNCTLIILYNLVVDKTPHRHRTNEQHVASLFATIQNTNDKDWLHFQYLHLFILLTGAVTSNDSTTTSYFKAQIIRVIYQMGSTESKRITDFLLRYLRMKQTLERPTRRATPPIELSQPITTDATYLYASWPHSRRSSSLRSRATSVGSTYGSASISGDHSPMIYAEPESNEAQPMPSLPQPYSRAVQSYMDQDILERPVHPSLNSHQSTPIILADRAFYNDMLSGGIWPSGMVC